VLGIPDLRVFADPYIDIEADRAKGRRIAERYADSDFAGLVRFYYSITDTVPEDQARRFTAGLLGAPARAAATLDAWEQLAGSPATGRFLEVGCGTAPLLQHAAARFGDVIGVDIAFRWLIVARKRLEEAGRAARLVCACAEALPLRAETWDVVAGESTLEVTREPGTAASEVFRVCRAGGRLYLTTPNRWSLGPDPHLGVPAGGWWPSSWLAAYARRHAALPPQRHLFSAATIRDLLRKAGFEDVRLALPDVAPAQRRSMSLTTGAAADLYQSAKGIPVFREMLLAVGPLLLATARRPGGAG
jgi:ubiquinone/menaquinone biosynthesis C-methylase UbiE